MTKLLDWFGWGRRDAKTERLQMRMPLAHKERLIALKVNTGAKSMSELVQWGFTLVEWMWEVHREGGKFIHEHSDGVQVEVNFLPWHEAAKGK